MRCRALPCGAIMCDTVPCGVLCCAYSFVHVGYHSTKYHAAIPGYTTPSLCVLQCAITFNAPSSAQLGYSSAAHRAVPYGAVPCRALPCVAVRCGTVRCCAVLCRAMPCSVLCCTYSFVHVRSHSTIYRPAMPRYTTSGLYVLHCLITLDGPSSAQLSYSSAARSTLPCDAVRCRGLPCGAVLCRAALCFLSNSQYQVSCEVPGTRYRNVRVYSSFCFLHWWSSLSVLFAFFLFASYTRSVRT